MVFFSGEIDLNDIPFRYGYFEIKCSLPIHPGSFPAFWLVGLSDTINNSYYNEIDIFEYSNDIALTDYYKQFTCGIYCDNNKDTIISYARKNPILSDESQDLRHPHVFSCEWLSNSVKWYVDGNKVNDFFYDSINIPQHPMNLRTNYAINNRLLLIDTIVQLDTTILIPHLQWMGTDVMTIDYIKVSQLNIDCNTEEIITSQSALDNFDYAVKKDIKILPSAKAVKVRNTDHVTLRATDYFLASDHFFVEYGGEFSVIIHECPCSN